MNGYYIFSLIVNAIIIICIILAGIYYLELHKKVERSVNEIINASNSVKSSISVLVNTIDKELKSGLSTLNAQIDSILREIEKNNIRQNSRINDLHNETSTKINNLALRSEGEIIEKIRSISSNYQQLYSGLSTLQSSLNSWFMAFDIKKEELIREHETLARARSEVKYDLEKLNETYQETRKRLIALEDLFQNTLERNKYLENKLSEFKIITYANSHDVKPHSLAWKDKIKKNLHGAVLVDIESFLRSNPNDELTNNAVMLSARFKKIETEKENSEIYDKEIKKFENSLLLFIDNIVHGLK